MTTYQDYFMSNEFEVDKNTPVHYSMNEYKIF